MNFLEFENHDLYFDEPLGEEDERLLNKAAETYPQQETETILLQIHARLPDNLTILVALYRFYYYQHRYHDALDIAAKATAISADMLGIKVKWEDMTKDYLGEGVFVSMGLIRFYMLCHKASAYLLMRIDEIEQAHARLKKIVELDPSDQFGAKFLYGIAEKALTEKMARQHNIESIFRR